MNTKPFDLSNVRNRIVERRMLKPSELLDHPGQWRDHTVAQAQAMAGVLREVGITDTLKVYISERAGGKLVTWDGHLRKSLDPDVAWPVDITDLTDYEADYALVTHDPLGALATADRGALDALLSSINSGEAAVQQMLSHLAEASGIFPQSDPPSLDDLADQFGTPQERDFWPFIRVQVAPEIAKIWNELMAQAPGEDEAAKAASIVAVVAEAWLA